MEKYTYIHSRLNKNKKKSKIIKIFFFTLILLIASSVLFNKLSDSKSQSSAAILPANTASPSPAPASSNDIKQKNNPLGNAIQDALAGTKGTYGIAVKNFKSGEVYYANEHKVFASASLYKLWVMAAIYQQIQTGTLQENEILSEDISVLNEKFQINPEFAEKTEGNIELSVSDALNEMITISDNYAALLLTEKIRLATIAFFLSKNDLTKSTLGINGDDPTSTPYDIALFFEKLYKGELANEEYTKNMIDLLKNQRLNNKLPKYLPSDIAIAHKTGELDPVTHDAGIVYAPTGNYIIVVLSESDNPSGAEDRIAEVSRSVYNYFTSLKP